MDFWKGDTSFLPEGLLMSNVLRIVLEWNDYRTLDMIITIAVGFIDVKSGVVEQITMNMMRSMPSNSLIP